MSDVTILAGRPIEMTSKPKYQLFPARADVLPRAEVILPGLWKQLHDEGIFEMFFHDHPNMTFGQFVILMSKPDEVVEFVCEMDQDGENIVKVAAISMLTAITRTDVLKRAVGNFLLMRDYWNHRDSDEIAQVILRHWYIDLEFDVICGITPKLNRAALQFIHRAGFQSVGELPMFCSYKGQKCPGIISYQTFKAWDARFNGGEVSGLVGSSQNG